jgi:hypothetical protein
MKQVPTTQKDSGHRKLWLQILAFLALLALIWLEPKIANWFEAHDQTAEVSQQANAPVSSASQGSESAEGSERVSPVPEIADRSHAPEYGRLKEIRTNVFQSSAGLIYRSGSEDGHRLKHVMQHAKDDPQKKIHGVFDGDGDRNIILAVIDEAWVKAKKGGNDVRSNRQNDRQVYTVNLRRRIGYVGGEEGERKDHPECRYLRIVLENDNEVISAFPTRSF